MTEGDRYIHQDNRDMRRGTDSDQKSEKSKESNLMWHGVLQSLDRESQNGGPERQDRLLLTVQNQYVSYVLGLW